MTMALPILARSVQHSRASRRGCDVESSLKKEIDAALHDLETADADLYSEFVAAGRKARYVLARLMTNDGIDQKTQDALLLRMDRIA